mmetsp:Transcript_35416/g.54194  ORF Transcript_35416/g.54194 Transcript_35416/m.54194 type:complete len:214 (-) Transcript_35416:545-1186(-)
MLVVHDTRAIDEVDSLGEGDVLPSLGLSGHGSHTAAVLLHEGVDDGTLSSVRVSDQTHTDVLLVLVQEVELLQQLDEGALAEGVGDTGLESKGRGRLRKVLHPLLGDRGRDQVAFVQDENEMLVGAPVPQVGLDELGTGSVGVTGVQHVEQNVGTINDLVQLFPNSFGLALRENGVLSRIFVTLILQPVQIVITRGIVAFDSLPCLREHLFHV